MYEKTSQVWEIIIYIFRRTSAQKWQGPDTFLTPLTRLETFIIHGMLIKHSEGFLYKVRPSLNTALLFHKSILHI